MLLSSLFTQQELSSSHSPLQAKTSSLFQKNWSWRGLWENSCQPVLTQFVPSLPSGCNIWNLQTVSTIYIKSANHKHCLYLSLDNILAEPKESICVHVQKEFCLTGKQSEFKIKGRRAFLNCECLFGNTKIPEPLFTSLRHWNALFEFTL